MIAFIVRRTIIGIAMLFAMVFVTFVLFFAPGNPAVNMCEKYCTPEKIQKISQTYGFDQPIMEQFGDFVSGLFVGRDYPVNKEYRAQLEKSNPDLVIHCDAPCLGYSLKQSASVNELIGKAAPVTISVSVLAFVLWMFFGILIGVLAAINQGKWLDKLTVGSTLVVYALPTFAVGVFLLQYAAIKWKIFAYPRWHPISDGVWPWLMGLTLPALVLALFYMAAYVRITRAFVLESLSEDYIRTARAKGLAERVVLFKHGLRAALTPLLSMAGLDFAALLAGAIITESVFNFPGLGMLAFTANKDSDLPILIGLVLVAGAAVIVMNIIVDILYAYVDPRVRMNK